MGVPPRGRKIVSKMTYGFWIFFYATNIEVLKKSFSVHWLKLLYHLTGGGNQCQGLCKIYCLGEKSRVAEGRELPRGVRGHAPGNILKGICAELQSGEFWDTILRNSPVCALTSSRLDDFPIQQLIYCNDNNIFWGEAGHFPFGGGGGGGARGKLLFLKYPR